MPPSKKTRLTLSLPADTPTIPSQQSPSNKIAIVGAWPEHWHKTPFDDPSWEIWAMSAGMWGKHPKWDRWFELHSPKAYPRYENIAKGYIAFITESATTQKDFPARELLEEFGPYFFTTGQVTWLLAHAITLKPERIGIWGVEAIGEYAPQRKDIHHFVQIAHDRGIKVEVPDGCTLLNKPKLYGFSSL